MTSYRVVLRVTSAFVAVAVLGMLSGTERAQAQQRVWAPIVNNGDVMPGTESTLFNSYNQPSINDRGLVVFRARSKGQGSSKGGSEGEAVAAVGGNGNGNGGSGGGGGKGGGGGGAGHGGGGGGGAGHSGGTFVSGIYERDMSPTATDASIVKIFDLNSLVPQPNNTGATFNEFASIPRIDMGSDMIATRGTSAPVWEYTLPDGTDTRAGTSGLFMDSGTGGPFTAMTLLGTVPGFEFWQVPGAPGTRFDQFPGAPAATPNAIVFKGNWTNSEGVGQTGVYYRDVTPGQYGGSAIVHVIADTSTTIPGSPDNTPFGSTAPPSAVGNEMVFLGLDNEDNPTQGGIYMAPLDEGDRPTLTPLVKIGGDVPGVTGATFSKIGEGLSFDGSYVSFWGAWGTETRTITLQCPTSGNKDLVADCKKQYPKGFTTTEPVNQGIFVTDTSTGATNLVAETGTGSADFYNFLYWVFSGEPSGTGGGEGTESVEPARWRSSAFTALSSAGSGSSYLVAFKGTKVDGTQGVYEAGAGQTPALTTVVDTNTLGSAIDSAVNNLVSPTPLMVTSVGIERDGFRNGQLAMSVSMANADASVSWAGLYLTGFSTAAP